jgi:hypothetical protein
MLIMLTLIHNNGGSNIIYYEMLSIKIVMQSAFGEWSKKLGIYSLTDFKDLNFMIFGHF